MAYIKQKNSDCVVVTEAGDIVEGSTTELLEHQAMATTDAYEIIDSETPISIKNKIIFYPSEGS